MRDGMRADAVNGKERKSLSATFITTFNSTGSHIQLSYGTDYSFRMWDDILRERRKSSRAKKILRDSWSSASLKKMSINWTDHRRGSTDQNARMAPWLVHRKRARAAHAWPRCDGVDDGDHRDQETTKESETEGSPMTNCGMDLQ